MKLAFEVANDGESVTVTLDEKTVIVTKAWGGSEVDLSELPDDTPGKVVLEEIWDVADQLLKAAWRKGEYSTWDAAPEDVLQDVYRAF